MGFPACEFCGKECRASKKSTAFGGVGVATDAELDRLLEPSVQRRMAARTGSGYAHDEGAPKNCYRLLLDVHNQDRKSVV